MRTDCDWFARRAQTVWKANPGRSMLLMVPQGCEEAGAARLVRAWVEANFTLPTAHTNHRPVCIELVSDGFETSAHFARAVSQRIASQLKIEVESEVDDFPTDVLQNAIEAASGAGAYPILMIRRFHAFANIRDGGMTSILSRLRSMECDGQMTTLAFSPMGYDAIRRMMDGEQPFLNSVYGDTHDDAVMTPLSREDFLLEATARQIPHETAHRLFPLGGGPDAVFMALLDLHGSDKRTLVGKCSERAGPKIDHFLERAFHIQTETDELLANLAIGRLNPAQEAFLQNHPLKGFLCKQGKSGELICSSPIVAHRILNKDGSLWSQYGKCLQAIEAADYPRAADFAESLGDEHPRLAAFRELVLLRGALTVVPDRGLLGLDWRGAAEAMKRLRRLDAVAVAHFEPWLQIVEASIQIIMPSKGNLRLQADELTCRASDLQVRRLLLFMMDGIVSAAPRILEPSARVRLLVNVPEAILQSLAAGYCDINFSAPPDPLPNADYDDYFSGKEPFSFSGNGQKLALGGLLVIVPAVLAQRQVQGVSSLTNADVMRPLQQKLVDTVRNPASHTIADFAQKDAMLLEELCQTWIAEWCRMEDLVATDELEICALAPRNDDLRALVTDC